MMKTRSQSGRGILNLLVTLVIIGALAYITLKRSQQPAVVKVEAQGATIPAAIKNAQSPQELEKAVKESVEKIQNQGLERAGSQQGN